MEESMEATFDLVIRGGTVVDGSGGEPFRADIAVNGRTIAALGAITGKGREEIDATGRIVTPGFVDIHTHYDGQLTWSQQITPSSPHGVTTIVVGNCGVGFAPCKPEDRERLIVMMEGVEDIPDVVMSEGLQWEWETFPEYLDAIGRRSYDVDVATQLPHSPLRLYVMGDRAVAREPASAADNARMAAIAKEAIEAGAIGLGTSRTIHHRTKAGDTVPSFGALEAELRAICEAMRDGGHGILQMVLDTDRVEEEMAMVRSIAKATDRKINYAAVQFHNNPDQYRRMLDFAAEARAEGLSITVQIGPRPQGAIMGIESQLNPFTLSPSFQAIDHLSLAEKVAIMRDPEFRARLIAEQPVIPPTLKALRRQFRSYDNIYLWGDTPDYMPSPEKTIARLAAEKGISPEELAYDTLLDNDGTGLLWMPFCNFAGLDNQVSHEMMADPNTMVGLGDGGAHVNSMCDATYPTYMLRYWTRDAGQDRTFPLPWVIRALTAAPAAEVGLDDRGLIAPGYKADLNIIDYETIGLRQPTVVHDLPAGGRRIMQLPTGYDATIVSGVVTYRGGRPTGEYPGRLIRGPQASPVAA
jgi:N-acyl-D-aspartate/D-glutamate deacylase